MGGEEEEVARPPYSHTPNYMTERTDVPRTFAFICIPQTGLFEVWVQVSAYTWRTCSSVSLSGWIFVFIGQTVFTHFPYASGNLPRNFLSFASF